MNGTTVARLLDIIQSSVSRAVRRGERLALGNGYSSWKGKEMHKIMTVPLFFILSAHLKYGYTLLKIARDLGLHYTTISKIVRQRLP